MAGMARAEALVQAMDRDAAFQAAVQEARTVGAKRAVLDAHGFADVSVEDMRAYVESKGGTLNVPQAGEELSDAELSAVAGGLTAEESSAIAIGGGVAVGVAAAAAA
jgi:predicted ribosomally synthesized peptide with nif11-like leader